MNEGRGSCAEWIPWVSCDWPAIRLAADWLGGMLNPRDFMRRSGMGMDRDAQRLVRGMVMVVVVVVCCCLWDGWGYPVEDNQRKCGVGEATKFDPLECRMFLECFFPPPKFYVTVLKLHCF